MPVLVNDADIRVEDYIFYWQHILDILNICICYLLNVCFHTADKSHLPSNVGKIPQQKHVRTQYRCWWVLKCTCIAVTAWLLIEHRLSVCVRVPLTTDAHSCSVPTTGISIFLCGDLSRRPSSGIPPACRMASLFLLVLLQLHRARAPQRATSTSRSWFPAAPETQSNSLTWDAEGGKTFLLVRR